ncbi:hypothetical protein J2Z83_000742 [Virgibacillus natechei]|uniref:DUF4352 domain-containing protein n=1 Tax=Virgibacillus natechei TaxID=1216297 RepID=A0ABS4ICI7_9BACI|nr:DUF4352 domain-containing protein [Virgibacillus natechei]MBP1968650.1 hypothetical protein [Virgibacillus natechei]UZD13755.1 DUF4352 domain-containing protein [Virgibacillus natechei]
MKKLLIILLAGIFIVGCSGNDGEENTDEGENGDDQVEENGEGDNTQSEDGEEDKDVYQVGETAETNSSSYGFPYEITVNEFEVTTDDIEGHSLEDFVDPTEDDRFVAVNVTLKNTGDESFVPEDKISAQLLGEMISETDYNEFFKEREEELEPGEEITGNVVYLTNMLFENDVVYFTYEAAALDNEVQFELPVPEE